MRILLVDDDQAVLHCVQDFLVDHGHQVVASSCAQQAANTISNDDELDLLVTDFNLGEALDGSDLARQFLSSHPTSKVVMMSGRPDLARHKVKDMGKLKLLSKPFRLNDLIEAIAS